ncbi:MAG: DNA polymerase I [Planctomycetota bacterium]|jgi:DNA polymerase-1|nr:DNA polymerase I [Planctomycetota bacterium]
MSQVLFLIDGHAQVYRAYYALEGMKSAAGQATGAAFGFARMLDDLKSSFHPDALATVFDSPGPTFRRQRYPEYKANRKPPPPELVEQFPLVREIVEAHNIPHYELEGFEADDLMGSLARQAVAAAWEVVLVSGDKDCGQLLQDGVRIFDPLKNIFIDSREFTARKGIPPEKLTDLMGLWGDSSDNIPGVPGIGEKTGAQLIREYGSLESLLERADEIKGKRGELIRANRELALLSKELATIDRNAPMELDLAAARLTRPDLPRLREIYARLGFRSLLAKLEAQPAAGGEAAAAGTGADAPADYRLVDGPEEFEGFLAELGRQKFIAIDTETTGLDPLRADLVGISFSWREGTGFYLPFRAPSGAKALSRDCLKRLKPVLEDQEVKKTGHHIRYDILALRRAGIGLAGVAFDSLIASSLVDGHLAEHGLKALAKRHFGLDMTHIEELIGEGKSQVGIDLAPVQAVARYAAADADVSLRLQILLEKRLDERGARKLFEEVELPLSGVLAEMQATGIRVDAGRLKAESAETGELLECLTREIHELAGRPFNIASPKQLAAVLFEEMGLPVVRKTQTGPSTDEAVLEELAQLYDCELADRVLEYRMYAKLKNTYLDALPKLINPETGRLHTSFSQVRTATGRLASSNPNLQNIPVRTERGRAVRAAFIPEDGWKMLAADYSQVELRVLAAFSGDSFLAQAFADGRDIHRAVAAEVNGVRLEEVTREQRSSAKAVNFGVIYGQGAHGLAAATGMSRAQAQGFIDGYFARFPRIREWMGETVAGAERNGYVETILGFRREIPDIRSSNRNRKARAEREAVNTVIQGSAADLIKTAMVRLADDLRRSGLAARLLLQIHDELLLECPPEEVEPLRTKVRKAMENAIPMSVPIQVDIGTGDNWLETK